MKTASIRLKICIVKADKNFLAFMQKKQARTTELVHSKKCLPYRWILELGLFDTIELELN